MGPNLTKPMDDASDDSSIKASSQDSFATTKTASNVRNSTVRKPPHISIQPWEGSPLTRRVFINQLAAYVYFHPTSFNTSSSADAAYDRCIWALSYFCGDASEVVGDYVTRLIEQKAFLAKKKEMEGNRWQVGLDLEWEAEWKKHKGIAPMDWEVFLEYTKTVSRKVTEKREREERKCNRWPMREIRAMLKALNWLGLWGALGLITFVMVLVLFRWVESWMGRNQHIVWVKGDGVVPNRGRFAGKNNVELF